MDARIAVVGVGCRFPDAWTPEQFWDNVEQGVVSMRELPEDLLLAAGTDRAALQAPDFVRVGTTLPGVSEFAADFFGYTPREAELIDPQQRIFLEVCWEALDRAGHAVRPDGPTVGVFAGSAAGGYSAAVFAERVRADGLAAAVGDLDLTLGGQADFMTSRTAYKLGLRGPAVSVQTGCSSSLHAVHYAALSLLAGECDLALAGGATVLEPLLGYRHVPGGAQSDDGYCRSFDHRSSGTNYSSGVGAVVLRPLGDALAAGDPVLAVLHGSAVGNDGHEKIGYAAPSPSGVATVVADALRVAGVPGTALRYAEAHGTATPLGDHVELTALTDALRGADPGVGHCRIGSVMSNIGHTGPAAGIAGFIKAVRIARTGTLPPHPDFDRPRDEGLLAESPFVIGTEPDAVPVDDAYVLVDSIGMGGSNAAAVLGPPPEPIRPPAPERDVVRLVLSARTRVELDELSRALADTLVPGDLAAGDVAHTLRVGRHEFTERRLVEAPAERLVAALRMPRPPLVRTVSATRRRAAVVAPEDADPALLAALRAALPDRTEVVADPSAVPAERFAVCVGEPHGTRPEPGHVLEPSAPDPSDELEAAAVTAWLHGVPVDWSAVYPAAGRRVVLPPYPFTRRRFWALDHLPVPAAAAPAPAATPATPATPETPARREAATGPPAGDRSGPGDPEGPGDADVSGMLEIWRRLFGLDTVGPDDEFGALGGTSLLSVRLVLEVQARFGIVVNVHRAGGGRVTARRLAGLVGEQRADPDAGSPHLDRMDTDDNVLVDRDLDLELGPLSPARSRGKDVLLTGATGYLGAFLLRELVERTPRTVHCLVRAADEEEGMRRLRSAADRFGLPAPDPDRVRVVPGDLTDVAKVAANHRDGELETSVGHVLHCAAKVVFTEPYRTLREDNVLPTAELLSWARGCGIRDVSYVSSLAATGPAMGAADRLLETRDQPLDPRLGGYGVTKWVCERLLDRADRDGMRIRVFRPGLIMADSVTGAGNDKDLVYYALVSGLAVGAHPADDRVLPMAPVDLVARAVVELAFSAGSVGRAYHLVSERAPSLRSLFAALADAGYPTTAMPLARWQDTVRARALEAGNPVLSTAALLELEGHDHDEDGVQATGWQPWLRRTGLDPEVTGPMLRRGIEYLARHNDLIAELVPGAPAPVEEGT